MPPSSLVCGYGSDGDLHALFSEALNSLLNGARLATIQTWIDRAEAKRLSSAAIHLAKAELALRSGRHMSAQAFAEAGMAIAAEGDDDWLRAAMVAGRAAHAGSREELALGFYRSAERAATTPDGIRDARWGQLMCASALELDETQVLLALLESTVGQSDPDELVRMVDKRAWIGLPIGCSSASR